ncbi:MAG: hypothetical protein ACLP1Q_02865 [Solirubrobacteraceae bacterium]
MYGVRIALIGGLLAVAVALGLVLTHSPASVAATNRVQGAQNEPIASTSHGASYCQAHEVLPKGSSAIRIWLDAAAGPRVSVVVSSDGHPITGGVRGSNWIGGSVTVPLTPLSHAVSGVTVCASFQLRDETIIAQGRATSPAIAAHEGRRALRGRIWIEYLRPGTRSWASLAPEVMRNMGLGRATSGTWIVYLALLLLVAVIGVSSNLVIEELR